MSFEGGVVGEEVVGRSAVVAYKDFIGGVAIALEMHDHRESGQGHRLAGVAHHVAFAAVERPRVRHPLTGRTG